jgi:hypothetical protein
VDNFVDNADESLLPRARKTPKRPESTAIMKIKPFKNNDLKNHARRGSNPDFFLPSVHKCRTVTFFRQSCCALHSRRQMERASHGGGGVKCARARFLSTGAVDNFVDNCIATVRAHPMTSIKSKKTHAKLKNNSL